MQDTENMDDVSVGFAERPGPSVPIDTVPDVADEQEQGICSVRLPQTTPALPKLQLLNLYEWDRTKRYDERPPTCLHYSIVWKVTLNKKLISKDTEQYLVLAPQYYWSFSLRPKLERLVRRKLSQYEDVTCDDTSIVVTNTSRSSEGPLVKLFDKTAIDWSIIERQLENWGELCRAGKKLKVDMTFNYSIWRKVIRLLDPQRKR
jgi:hypothetical protein